MKTPQEQLQVLFSRLEDAGVDRTRKHPFLRTVFMPMSAALAGIDDGTGREHYRAASTGMQPKPTHTKKKKTGA